VFASSGGVVYDDRGTLPHVETSRKLPLSPYGVSKIGSEYYLAAYARLYGLAVVSLRYANVYGPRQNPHGEAGVVAIFGKKLTTGDPLLIYGDGEQTRDYVYVGDVAQANLAATRAAAPVVDCLDDPAFNIGTGRETSVNELARLLMAGAGRSVPIRHEAARPGELARSALNCAKAGEAWGWRPGMSIAEGLKRTYDWILEAAA
jgi:UDP-glucose 4-epimerase